IDDEVLYHLDLQIESFLAKGLSPAAARQAALDAFGDVTAIRRALRTHDRRKLIRAGRADMLPDLVYHLRYAIRHIRAAPRCTKSVVLVLALGIGANTAIFSAIDAAFFRPLPFPQAERLVSVAEGDLPFELSLGHAKQEMALDDIIADSAIFARAAAYA